jgi:hypothetical protein
MATEVVTITRHVVRDARKAFEDHAATHHCRPRGCPQRLALYRRWVDMAGSWQTTRPVPSVPAYSTSTL